MSIVNMSQKTDFCVEYDKNEAIKNELYDS